MEKYSHSNMITLLLVIVSVFLVACGEDSNQKSIPEDSYTSSVTPPPQLRETAASNKSVSEKTEVVPTRAPQEIIEVPTSKPEIAATIDPVSVEKVMTSFEKAIENGYSYGSRLSMNMRVSFGEQQQDAPLLITGDVNGKGDFQGEIDLSTPSAQQVMKIRVIGERTFTLYPDALQWFELPAGQKTINPPSFVSYTVPALEELEYVSPEIIDNRTSHHVKGTIESSTLAELVPLLTESEGSLKTDIWVEVETGRLILLSMKGSANGGPEVRGPSGEDIVIDVEVSLEAYDFAKEVTISVPDLPPSPTIMSWPNQPNMEIDASKDYRAIIKIYGRGEILIDLLEKEAPITVNNFVFLSKQGFYDGVTFHRVIPDFMAQGGDQTGTGSGGPGYVFENEFHNSARHNQPGVVSMANSGIRDGKATNGSQFFITYRDTSFLDGLLPDGSAKNCSMPGESCHSVFGRVIKGMELVEAITPRDPMQGGPADVIESVSITID